MSAPSDDGIPRITLTRAKHRVIPRPPAGALDVNAIVEALK